MGMTPAAAAMLEGACDDGLADGGKPFLDIFCASGGVAVRIAFCSGCTVAGPPICLAHAMCTAQT